MSNAWTPGPWEYVPSTEHHGPYVAAPFGGDVADCYVMSNPTLLSERNGGKSRPIPHQAEAADANARLIAAAPELYEALEALLDAYMENAPSNPGPGFWDLDRDSAVIAARAALAKARGE